MFKRFFITLTPHQKKERVNFQTDYSNDTAAKNKKYQICFGCSVSSKLCLIFFRFFHLRWLTVLTEETSLRLKVVSSSSLIRSTSAGFRSCREAKSQEMGEMLRSPMLPPMLSEPTELRPSEGTPNCRSVPSLTSRSNSPSKICRA